MGIDMALLLTYVGVALSVSFLCSVLEATLLSARVIELSARKEHGDRGAAILLEIKQNRIDDGISAILTLNTIAHTIGAALAGAQAAIVFGDTWVGVFSGVLTLLVLVVTEIIPKTLGTVYASRLTGFVGRTIRLLTKILAPVLFMTRGVTKLLATHEKKPITRAELAALVGMASSSGTLAGDEKRVFDNVLKLNEVTVADIMTPRTVAVMLPAQTPLGEILEHASSEMFSRIPLFKENRDQIVGYIKTADVLRALAADDDPAQPLSNFAREAWFIPETVNLGNALKEFLTQRGHMAMVADEFGAVGGIVTFEDVIETILGAEIIDESDRVVDMRALAIQLRDARMKRKQEKLPAHEAEGDAVDTAAAVDATAAAK